MIWLVDPMEAVAGPSNMCIIVICCSNACFINCPDFQCDTMGFG